MLRQKRPQRSDLLSLAVIALGVVIGFPLLTALALRSISSAHSIVFIGLLPLATAAFGVLRGGERPKPLFWLFSVLGSLLVVALPVEWRAGLAARRSSDDRRRHRLRPWLCGGGKLARSLGGWQVICWALVLSMPPMAVLCLFTWPQDLAAVPVTAWAGLSYVTVFSMLVAYLLVSRAGEGRHSLRRAIATSATLLRAFAGGTVAGRGGFLVHACSNHCVILCVLQQRVTAPATKASKMMSSIKGIKAGARSGRAFLFYVIEQADILDEKLDYSN